ncbi:MAG: hypothetical protein ABSA52_19555 [Candidatus Binatia bacterium]|jgi:hypothetical protein
MSARGAPPCGRWVLVLLAVIGMGTSLAWGVDEKAVGGSEERRLAAIAFQPANGAINYVVEEGGLGPLCTTKGAGYFVAPLQFQDGTVIEEITAFLDDTSRDSLGMMSLVRRGLERFDILALTPVSVGTGKVETLSTTAITAPAVDNHDATYLLQVVLSGPGVCLYGAQVRYRVHQQ